MQDNTLVVVEWHILSSKNLTNDNIMQFKMRWIISMSRLN